MFPSPESLWPDVAPDWITTVDPVGFDAFINDVAFNIYKFFLYQDRYEFYLTGISNTLMLTFFALVIGVILGIIIALTRVTWDTTGEDLHGAPRVILRIANKIAKIYLTVIRGTPVVVQVMIMFFVVFRTSRNQLMVGALAFGINSGAYVAEIVRGGIMSVDKGQMEAGRSLGFGYIPTMRHIILPQAVKNSLPSLANEFITLLKETSVVGYIGLMDLTYAGNVIGGNAYSYAVPLGTVAIVYLSLVMLFTALVGRLERRLSAGDKRTEVRRA